ncbi:hypothetical protein [Zunongwangia sp. HGR-M22]|uniref:hypothetical protein n=1 Tax=Zunongwangia sp. HGR-M22 TaxID=3015168 RepID=UPI0022DD47D1|nr:hypothetical protein [Zunongwangia sp. HGR-M22]WBL25578.1 hypothetical protein PBT91_17000 [Zunongwangia sp. HGR-M22]
MKASLRYLYLLIFLVGCAGDDDAETECSSRGLLLDSYYAPECLIRLVDASGENLLENGSIDPETLTIESDLGNPEFIYIPEIEYAEPNSILSETQYSLGVFLLGNMETFQYQISIDGYETVDLVIQTEQIEEPCYSYIIPVGASVNGEVLEEIEISDFELLVILPLAAQE